MSPFILGMAYLGLLDVASGVCTHVVYLVVLFFQKLLILSLHAPSVGSSNYPRTFYCGIGLGQTSS